jgi:hypothetical protein
MARFLSEAWFEELARAAHRPAPAAGTALYGADGDQEGAERRAEERESARPGLVVEVIASGGPEGEVRYQLVVEADGPRLVSRSQEFRPAQVELRAGYSTLADIASGSLSVIDALSGGLARVSGNISALSANQARLGGLDLLPPSVRASTTF